MGGLIARGEGPCAKAFGGRRAPDVEATGEKRLSGPLLTVGEVAGGLVAELGPGVAGGLPELNSAHRGHLRLVSMKVKIISHDRM